jgi:hypothetical protein
VNWAYLIGIAHRIGWTPDRFWLATWYEFTTAIAAHAEMLNPRPPEVTGADLAQFFRGQPGYRKKKGTRAHRPGAGP